MESRQVSVFRIERHRGRRAVATTDPANGRARAGDSLAVVIVAFRLLLVNPRQVLPPSKVAIESQALRDLVT
jgi:hypothetical protein